MNPNIYIYFKAVVAACFWLIFVGEGIVFVQTLTLSIKSQPLRLQTEIHQNIEFDIFNFALAFPSQTVVSARLLSYRNAQIFHSQASFDFSTKLFDHTLIYRYSKHPKGENVS